MSPSRDGAASEATTLTFGPGVDRWLLLLIGLVLLSMVGTFRALWADEGGRWAVGLFLLLALAFFGLILLLTMPLRYTVDAEALQVRAGVLRYRWALADLVRLETGVGVVASPTAGWTVHRLMLLDAKGRSMELGPADRDGLVAALLARAPQLVAETPSSRAGRKVWRDPKRDRWGRGA